MYTNPRAIVGIVQPLTCAHRYANILHRMTNSKIRALVASIDANIDCALNGLVWADNPEVVEDLNNARALLEIILEGAGDPDDPDELDF